MGGTEKYYLESNCSCGGGRGRSIIWRVSNLGGGGGRERGIIWRVINLVGGQRGEYYLESNYLVGGGAREVLFGE